MTDQLANWIPVPDVAAAAGVTAPAVRHWIKRHRHARRYKVRDGTGYLHHTAADEYLLEQKHPRLARRPYGWIPMKVAAARVGLSFSSWHDYVRDRPRIRTARVASAIFVHPDDVAHHRLLIADERCPPGWQTYGSLAAELDRPHSSIQSAVRDLGIAPRRYRRPPGAAGNPVALHVSPADAERIREWSATARRPRPRR